MHVVLNVKMSSGGFDAATPYVRYTVLLFLLTHPVLKMVMYSIMACTCLDSKVREECAQVGICRFLRLSSAYVLYLWA